MRLLKTFGSAFALGFLAVPGSVPGIVFYFGWETAAITAGWGTFAWLATSFFGLTGWVAAFVGLLAMSTAYGLFRATYHTVQEARFVRIG